jgi:magnesium-transporting ATPase (P-type)
LVFTAYAIAYLGSMDQDVRYRSYLSNKLLKKKKQQYKNPVINDLGELAASDNESVVPLIQTKVQKSIKDNFQHLYYITQKNIYYDYRKFWLEVLDATVDGVIITIVMFLAFWVAPIDSDGRMGDFWFSSITMYSILIVAVNVKTLFRAAHITVLLLISIFVTSIIPFYLFAYFYDHWENFNEHSHFSARFTMSTLGYWLSVLLISFYVCFLEIFKFFGKYYFNPSMVEYVKQLNKMKQLNVPGAFSHEMIGVIKKHHVKALKNKKITDDHQDEQRKANMFKNVARGH